MAFVALSTTGESNGLELASGGNFDASLTRAITQSPPHSPLIILLHGKGYAPGVSGLDPHDLIFAPSGGAPGTRFVSWPRRLGFSRPLHPTPRGVCIAFGWASTGSIWRVARTSFETATTLTRLLNWLHERFPGRRVDFICHSLGARVCLRAVETAAPNSIGRVILLAGAAFSSEADRAVNSPAGETAEFFNVISRENDLFDYLFETALSPLGRQRALGAGYNGPQNWLDIQLDHPSMRDVLSRLGIRLAPDQRTICHWSVYLRPGAFAFYRRLLLAREDYPLSLLHPQLCPPPEPRWARIAPLLSRSVRETVSAHPSRVA